MQLTSNGSVCVCVCVCVLIIADKELDIRSR